VVQQQPECPQQQLPPGVRTTVWTPRSQVAPALLVNESSLLFCALMSFCVPETFRFVVFGSSGNRLNIEDTAFLEVSDNQRQAPL